MIRYNGKLYFTAKDVCSRLEISKKTLYNWEKNGLIQPAIRDWRNWRLFTEEDIINLARFIEAKKSGDHSLER